MPYRGHTVYVNDLPSQAYLILEMLNILEGFDITSMGHNSADAIHVMAEAKKLAFANRLDYVGDPAFASFSIDSLLSKEFAVQQQSRIDMRQATENVSMKSLNGIPGGAGGNTSYFCVVDAYGNAVSFIHSLSGYFGCGVIPGSTGMLLNNRSGRSFYLQEGHPNVIAPGKRPINTIQTYMVFDGGKPWLIGGTPGGDSQPQLNVQAISNVIDFGLNVQDAVDAPRWVHFPGTDPATIDRPFELRMEEGIKAEVKSDLQLRGHRIAEVPPDISGGALQFIEIDGTSGIHIGATDSRCDGYSIPE
jgi:gamma-glutamyltranspeptidase/glutathione hydrolase